MKLVIRLLLMAIAFTAVLPHIPGIMVHGTFLTALGLAVLFSVMLWVVDLIAVALSAVLTVTSLGIALLWLIPLWILGFWMLPAVALKMVADFMPASISIAGWTPAFLGGLVMLLIGMVTTDISKPASQA